MNTKTCALYEIQNCLTHFGGNINGQIKLCIMITYAEQTFYMQKFRCVYTEMKQINNCCICANNHRLKNEVCYIDMCVVQSQLSVGAAVRLAASSRNASAFSASIIYTTKYNKLLANCFNNRLRSGFSTAS